jgi:hypothetical protein
MGQLSGLRVTTVPLEAPAGPLGQLGWPFSGTENGIAAGAWFQASSSSYTVTIGACSPVPPPSVHAVIATSCSGATASAAGLGGETSFRGVAYKSGAEELAALALPAPKGPSEPVALGEGLTGTEYKLGRGTVDWTSGRWHFRVDLSGCPANLAAADPLVDARQMIALARSHPLPSGPGSVEFQSACGDPTSTSGSVTWEHDDDVYSTFALDSYTVPMRLSAAMRPY